MHRTGGVKKKVCRAPAPAQWTG